MALAVCSQASVLPWGASPWAAHAVASPWGASPWGVAPWGASPWSAAPWGVSPWAGVPAAVSVGPSLHSAVHAVHAPAILPVAHEGTYTAANRGSVHVAPLPGHLQSATSLNLAPAPGTTW